ncbi:ketopantoate reductase family protein [Streptomyces sp. NPDC058374]|uniref:ketopantoate reductase family protein n=1 Tax=unclassified Streptomyces TaxID=2593676 RepID=UPI00365E38F0
MDTRATTGQNPAPWTVAVLGPGGIGGLVASLLARRGHRVICVAGEQTAKTLNEQGLALRSGQFGDGTVEVEAVTELTEPVDLCVIATKETGLAEALQRVPAAALGTGLVLPLLNGFEHVALLRETYPAGQVVPAVIWAESTRTAPGVIEHTTPFCRIELAGATAPAARLAALGALLEDAGMRGLVHEDETALLWDKLAFLAPFALLTTRHAAPVGTVRTEHREELTAVVAEVARVAATVGAPTEASALLAKFDNAPEGMRSSMQRDAAAGRPVEIEAIGRALLRQADRAGTQVPALTSLVTTVARTHGGS